MAASPDKMIELERRIEASERKGDVLEQSMTLVTTELSGLRQMSQGLIDADFAKGEAIRGAVQAYSAAVQRAEVAHQALIASETKNERRVAALERQIAEQGRHIAALEQARTPPSPPIAPIEPLGRL